MVTLGARMDRLSRMNREALGRKTDAREPDDDQRVDPGTGPLLVLTPGLGAVATTFMAGVELVRQGKATPVGSVTQLGSLTCEGEETAEPMRDLLPLARLQDLTFAGWDIHGEDALTVARRSDVLTAEHLAAVHDFLAGIHPMPGVHHEASCRSLQPVSVVRQTHRREQAEQLRQDIRDQMDKAGARRAVAVFVASTERKQPLSAAHLDLQAFERGLDKDDPSITPTQLYAYACLQEGVPFANGTPNASVDVQALKDLALHMEVPIAGRDLKTGQTLLKTVVAPGLRARLLGVHGWFSTNILGNRDGAVLDDREAFASKESTKKGVLDTILSKTEHPELWGDISHLVNINYYPPRGDQKEGWDNIDIFGWLGYPMQVKINFLCRDSILAAPLVLDIALLMDLAQRAGHAGVQDWLGFFFKAPMAQPGLDPEHDLFAQEARLHDVLARIAQRSRVVAELPVGIEPLYAKGR
jgi:myo-inositol-1-phosphate synthase